MSLQRLIEFLIKCICSECLAIETLAELLVKKNNIKNVDQKY